jgi:hypothetical protein
MCTRKKGCPGPDHFPPLFMGLEGSHSLQLPPMPGCLQKTLKQHVALSWFLAEGVGKERRWKFLKTQS